VNRWDLANIVSSVFGILLLYDPLNFSAEHSTSILGVICGISAAVFVAGSNTVVRRVNADFHPLISIFY